MQLPASTSTPGNGDSDHGSEWELLERHVGFPGLKIESEGWIVGGRYMVDIGSNNITSSKNVFTGTNIASGEKIEIRVASGKDGRQLRKTASICKALAGCSGFPFIRDVYKAGDSYTMVYDALGRRLEDLTTGASLKTCLLIFYQLITRLEFMHGRLLVHGGIRPGDLRMGYGMRGNQVVLTNFRTSSSDKKFASIERSHRADMVSLGYLIIYWVHGLPWRDVVEDDRILNMKQDIPVETLCLCPPEFKTYFNHIRSLSLDEKPDYKYLRKLVKEAFDRNGFVWDYIFDWHGPERSPVSQERLVAAFKSMYHELGEAEVQCLTFDHFLRQLTSINPDQLRRASDMHISIHARFHDNFLASQHPSASPALRRLARQYCMPERLRDGIHVFLESLRYLPDTQDCMLSFSYSAYLAMIVFHEEFPNFDDTWLESLGHLSRYLFFITDDQRFWMLACSWYSKASNQYPKIGRFHQDVAITSRSPFQKLFYGCKALCAEDPLDVRKSILDGFDVILEGDGSSQSSLDPLDVALLEAHAILFTGKKKEHFQLSFKKLLDLANTHPERVTVQIAIINITAILGFASERSFMGRRNVKEIDAFKNALRINNSILKLLLRNAHTTILPFLYTILVFMHCMSHYPGAMRHLEFPWKLSSNLLNSLPAEDVNPECIEVLRLQLDQALSGLSWAKGHFENANLQGKSLVERIRSLMHDLAGKDTHEACSTPSGNDEVSTLSSGVEGICLGDLDD